MTPAVDLLASYWTISAAHPHTDREYSPFDFRERVESAARAGFKGFGIWHADLDHVRARYSLKEMKQILADKGIRHVELEFLADWFLNDNDERRKLSDIRKHKLFEAAEVLGARHIKVGDFFQEQCPLPRLIDAFAALSEEAAQHNTRIGFELMPFAMIRTLKESLAMVKGAPNGGIIFDLWHIVKLGIPYEEVFAVPQQHVVSIELNDGTLTAPWSLHEDTINHRRLCGEGEFDVRGFVQGMRKAGYNGPWGIEVLSADLRMRPLEELTTRSFSTTIAQFEENRR